MRQPCRGISSVIRARLSWDGELKNRVGGVVWKARCGNRRVGEGLSDLDKVEECCGNIGHNWNGFDECGDGLLEKDKETGQGNEFKVGAEALDWNL